MNSCEKNTRKKRLKYFIHINRHQWLTLWNILFIPFLPVALGQTFLDAGSYNSLIEDYYIKGDSLKGEATQFLVKNMPFHSSEHYYWADSLGQKLSYSELDYPSFKESIKAFNELKRRKGKVSPIPISEYDLEVISAEDLHKVVEFCFQTTSKHSLYEDNFDLFCEYVLPYRVDVEPYQNWHEIYSQRFSKVLDINGRSLEQNLFSLKDFIRQWFSCTYNLESRSDPIPRLGSLQLLHRKKGGCEDVAALSTFALRSLGIPSTIDIAPYWSVTAGGHVWNVAFDATGNPRPFDVLLESKKLHELMSLPAKVFRQTFSNQARTLANLIDDFEIPKSGLLRATNYIDVTSEYSEVMDIACDVYDSKDGELLYAAVYNAGKWRPVWWGNVSNDRVVFSDMSVGSLVLPMRYHDGYLTPVGQPTAAVKNSKSVAFDPLEDLRSVKLKALPGYHDLYKGEWYMLYYFDRGWKLADKRMCLDESEIRFENIPKNAVLMLRYEGSQRTERPFIIDENMVRIWW